jgi:lipoprotein NlpD
MGGRGRAILSLVFVACACSTSAPGIHHVVRPGENLYRIGKAYGVSYLELARINGIADPSRIEVGQRIFVPGATRPVPVGIVTPRRSELGSSPWRPGQVAMIWPTAQGEVSSSFGPRGDSFHDGIDIAAPVGTPVYAAFRGRVVYSDRLPGYGNIVILDHGGGLTTVYAHNRENLVREGQFVEQGQRISTVGESGRTTGANLHFEVRDGNVARDPLNYLPPRPIAERGGTR